MSDQPPLPHNLEAEKSVLGACLIRQEAIDEIRDLLDGDDFFRDAHRRIWRALRTVHDNGLAVDLVTVRDHLAATNELDEVGGPAYVSALADGVPRSTNVQHYAQVVFGHSVRRRLFRLAMDPASDVDAIKAAVEQLESGAATAKPIGEYLEAALTPPAKDDLIASGLGSLDRLLSGGLRRGEVVTIAARPSHGKTALGLQLAANAVVKQVRTAIVSLEMPGEALAQRLISAQSKTSLADIRRGEIDPAAYEAAESIMPWPLDVLERVSTVGGIGRHLKRAPGTRLVIVDYAQLLDAGQHAQRYGSRVQEIATISRGLKMIAVHHRVSLVLLCQLNREVEKRADGRPKLSDLRESGTLEQDSDVVVSLYRPALVPTMQEDDEGLDEWRLNAEVLKNRQGPVGRLTLHFDTSTQAIHEAETSEEWA